MKKSTWLEQVYAIVCLIPPGRVTTYGAIAQCIGTSKGARMVGWALNQAVGRADLPAHRVVNSQGILTGKHHFGNPERMAALLQQEGVDVVNDQVQNFQKVFWDPQKELEP